MPTLEWIGKTKVVNHHLDVPYCVLDRKYSYDENGQHEEDNGSENMIIHGDNLLALKSLLPQYEGRIKCIYIDEAISGTNRNHRTEFNQMMQDALDGKIDYIITKSISRFARNTVDTLNCVRQLRQCDPPIGVYFEKEYIKTAENPVKSRLLAVYGLICSLFVA